MIPTADGVHIFSRSIAKTNTQEADDNLVGINAELIISQADAPARRGLASNGNIRFPDLKWAFEANCAANSENDGTRPGGFYGGAKAVRTAVVEVGNLNDATTSTTNGLSTGPFGTGKRRDRRDFGTRSHTNGREYKSSYGEKI